MRVIVYPAKANGTVWAPPSKSVSHRALICGALTDGCTIKNCGSSQDIEATVRCLSVLGADIKKDGNTIKIGRLNPFDIPNDLVLDCGESGSTLRFLLPLCLLSGRRIILTGQGRLMQRPMSVYEDLCRDRGFLFKQEENAITISGRLESGVYLLPGDISSQFVTGLLLALSQLSGESRVEVSGHFESASYVDITLAVLSEFGVRIERVMNTFIINGQQRMKCANYVVESDCSNAAALDALNLIGGSVKVLGLTDETPQGDWAYRRMFTELVDNKMDFDLSDCPDLGPVMFALSAVFGGAKFTGTHRLRMKESDRCAAMAVELAKFGISTEIEENAFQVFPGALQPPTDVLCGHNDHRIVMALSLLCTLTGGSIDGAEAVAKSFPNFFENLMALGIDIQFDND